MLAVMASARPAIYRFTVPIRSAAIVQFDQPGGINGLKGVEIIVDGSEVANIKELAAESCFQRVGCVVAIGPEAIGGVELEGAIIVFGFVLSRERRSVVGRGIGGKVVGNAVGVGAQICAFAVVPDTLSQRPVGGENVTFRALVVKHRLCIKYMLLESRFAYVGAVRLDARI